MAKRISDMTAEELALHNEQKKYRKSLRGLTNRVASQCHEHGLRSVELQLDFIKKNPKTMLPNKELDHEDTVSCFEKGIDKYKAEIR